MKTRLMKPVPSQSVRSEPTPRRWSHRQRPVDAAHLVLQSEQMHEEEDQQDDKEPQRHQLKELERRPLGPAVSAVDAQEGDQQRHLQQAHTTAA